MLLDCAISFAKQFEDPEYPLLGPNLKGLYLCGLWQTGTRFRNIIYNTIHVSTICYVITQFIEFFLLRHDLNKALDNFSLTTLSLVCCMKSFSYVLFQKKWLRLVNNISQEERMQLKMQDAKTLNIMKRYTKYSRVITYSYWCLVISTMMFLIIAPLLKYLTAASYREDIKSGKEPYPEISSSWFPFDNKKMPGYLYASIAHAVLTMQQAAVLATYDTNAITIMTFIKGQIEMLRGKCMAIFECDKNEGSKEFNLRIKECHRHHTFLLEQYKLFNSLLSPVMFVYVLLCSTTICCSVVQFTSSKATAAQKLWVIQFTTAQVSQLFLICWHSNEIFTMSDDVDQGVYESNWWKADVHLRKQIILLAGKLNRSMYLTAGPFTDLSIATFVSILKGSYSFFTLFSQMQE